MPVAIGMRARAIEQDPSLADDAEFEPEYEAKTMGALTKLSNWAAGS